MTEQAAIKASLEAKLKELLERASGLENVLSDPGDTDLEENAQETEGDEALLAVGDLTKREIIEIKLALHRLESGSYGVCASCGKKISKERLATIPWATTCVDCV